MARYHERFQRLKLDTIMATKALFAHHFYRLTDEEKQRRFEQWLADVSSIYGLPVPSFKLGSEAEAHGSGVYHIISQQIILPKYSIVSLMHEFRHHMQSTLPVRLPSTLDAIEDDARAWSLSLFYAAKPRLFEKSVREGKIFFVSPEDLEQQPGGNEITQEMAHDAA